MERLREETRESKRGKAENGQARGSGGECKWRGRE